MNATKTYEVVITDMYEAFNSRDIDRVFTFLHPQVKWPNGWEGGYVYGHSKVRDYWTRQWKELNPIVKPIGFRMINPNLLEVSVHQLVKDTAGTLLADSNVLHTYTFDEGLISAMEISEP
jgi:nuclear transport factor 2 (NTF2) superfamily protein